MAERETRRGASLKPGEDQKRGEQEREEQDRREEESLKARLDKLTHALDAQKDASGHAPADQDLGAPTAGSLGSAMSLGFRVLSEFVAAVVVGFLIGWQIDVWIGTTPWFLLIFLALGTAAGFWNVYRIAVTPQGSRDGDK
ncbi:AtpZ/AtpI family protein [Methylocapsa acidiphila]|uniref:AtpZ/AtpI family protein n=1 Tax=Methylocapsa acidiphila TaxID=133552 RepID=UPI0003FF42E3|nr:AtpZ/AtpI family protein [Methylocapsa acidiphila]